MRSRVRIIQLIFTLWATLLLFRLGYWQIVKAGELSSQAEFQQTNRLSLPAARGQILARDGFPLVENIDNYLVYVNPQLAKERLSDLETIFKDLPSSESALPLITEAKNSKLNWLVIARNIPQDIKNRINELKIPGLGFESYPTRSYPEGSPSAYLTGFVGKSETDLPQGYFGLEGYYDRYLKGTAGKLIEEKDALGMPIVIGNQFNIPARPGTSLVTSIDRVVQHVAYKNLVEGIQKYEADSGTVTVLETQTGRVLAMVSVPGYDPKNYQNFSTDVYKNPIVSSSYEPGSTFKTLIMAAGLDAGVITKNSTCDTCSSPQTISGQVVKNYDDSYYPNNSMSGIILHSDNVGMVYIGRKLGKDRLLDYLKKFGFGKPTGIDLQEESSPEIRPNNEWYDIDWATASFGQGIAVTPIQMTAAVNSIATQGLYYPPRVVTELREDGESKTVSLPKPTQVISKQAAADVTEMMVNGVNNGQVKWYKPDGYTIAGKTGTAQVPIAGHYDKDKVIASFVGFAPVPNPKFTMLVTVSNPKTTQWGSTTAAPIFFAISKELFRYYQVPPAIIK